MAFNKFNNTSSGFPKYEYNCLYRTSDELRTLLGFNAPEPVSPKPKPITHLPKSVPLVLKPHQTAWFNRIVNDILPYEYSYFDTTKMGLGKTVMALAVAKALGIEEVFGIVPANCVQNWYNESVKYGFDINKVMFISFESLIGKSTHLPNNKFIERADFVGPKGKTISKFTPKREFIDAVNRGILMVFDEIQRLKNPKMHFSACLELCKVIHRSARSRCAYLSGTPFCKPIHSVNVCRLLGFIRSDKTHTFNSSTRTIELTGAQELIESCMFINPAATEFIVQNVPHSKAGEIPDFCMELFYRVISPFIGGGATKIEDPHEMDAKNGIYNIHPDFRADLKRGIDLLSSATRSGNLGYEEEHSLGDVNVALNIIETAKRFDIARIVYQWLVEDPSCKVVIAVNFIETVNYLMDTFRDFNPSKLVGEIPTKKRAAIISNFNSINNNRVLVMTVACGGEGISLHDTTGVSPHHMVISPIYTYIKTAQASFRTDRCGRNSLTKIRIFYGKGENGREPGELSIYHNAESKNKVVHKSINPETSEEIKLPGDYEKEIEPDFYYQNN